VRVGQAGARYGDFEAVCAAAEGPWGHREKGGPGETPAPRAALTHVDAAAVDDADGLRDRCGDVGGDPCAEGRVHLLRLLLGRDLSGPNSPDGLVRDDDARPLLGGQHVHDGLELPEADLEGLARLALGEGLPDADDGGKARIQRGLGLGRGLRVGLLPDGAALAVAGEDPRDAGVLHLVHGVRASVGAEALRRRGGRGGGGDDGCAHTWPYLSCGSAPARASPWRCGCPARRPRPRGGWRP
jgi:hypothetical protein